MKTVVLLVAISELLLAANPAAVPAPGYALGSQDVIAVRVQDIDEYNAQSLPPIRIDAEGNIRLPLIGRVHAAGLSVGQLELKVREQLDRIMNDPDVSVTVTEFGSRPVSVLGAVRNPGVLQVSGNKTLYEVLSLAGGLSPDAGNAIEITRHAAEGLLPLAGAASDPSGQYIVARLNVRAVMEAQDPTVNINVLPDDVITVPKADMVYVIGAVKKAGGFVLNEKEHMSVLQALSLAEGLDGVAAAKSARILRQNDGETARVEIPVNLSLVLEGTTQDIALHANDILFVPISKAKNASLRAIEAAVQIGTGVVIYRR